MAGSAPLCYEELGNKLGCYEPILKFSAEARKIGYTANAIEYLNNTYGKLNR